MPEPLPPWTELRCPATGAPVAPVDGALATPDAAIRYPVVEGVPVLIDSGDSVFDLGDYLAPARPSGAGMAERVRRFLLRLAAWQPPITRNTGSRENYARLAELLSSRPTDAPARVLVIGGRLMGVGSEALLERGDVEAIETDVSLGPRTQLICDAMRLPFPDDSFDAVTVQAVLDCVTDPHQAVAEMHRVLKSDGLLYSETAFIQQQHDAAHDFWRFTAQGHRRLMRNFDELACGVQCGPGTAMAWTVRAFARSLAGSNRVVRVLFGRLAALACVWMPLLDPWLVKRPEAMDSASGTYFLGRRRDGPVSDAEILARYGGAQRDPYKGARREAPT